jgi:hypothetical protein
MVVDGSLEVPKTWCPWLVRSHLDCLQFSRRGAETGVGVAGRIRGFVLHFARVTSGGVETESSVA